jgi:two-component system, cell cycle response regulator
MTIRQTALVGFSPFETMTLESFFRLAGRRPPGYSVVTDVEQAHVLIVNGDNAQAVQALWATLGNKPGILIGNSAHGTGWVAMARPIRLLAVLEMIEKLLQAQPVASPATSSQPFPPTLPIAKTFESTVPIGRLIPGKLPPVASPSVSASAIAGASAKAENPPGGKGAAKPKFGVSRGGLMGFGNSTGFEVSKGSNSAQDQAVKPAPDDDLILVVDDSDIVLRFMQGRLQRFGYSVELASTGEQAVDLVKVKPYKFVFLDVMMPGMDGYQTCRAIKANKSHGQVPVVVMLSSRGGSIDKIRGTLAGSDAYLTKPLAEAALIKVLADHDTQQANNFSATRPVSGLR